MNLQKIAALFSENIKYNIGDTVYHVTPNSRPGVIVNWIFNGLDRKVDYFISFGPGEVYQMMESEISTNQMKSFNNDNF